MDAGAGELLDALMGEVRGDRKLCSRSPWPSRCCCLCLCNQPSFSPRCCCCLCCCGEAHGRAGACWAGAARPRLGDEGDRKGGEHERLLAGGPTCAARAGTPASCSLGPARGSLPLPHPHASLDDVSNVTRLAGAPGSSTSLSSSASRPSGAPPRPSAHMWGGWELAGARKRLSPRSPRAPPLRPPSASGQVLVTGPGLRTRAGRASVFFTVTLSCVQLPSPCGALIALLLQAKVVRHSAFQSMLCSEEKVQHWMESMQASASSKAGRLA